MTQNKDEFLERHLVLDILLSIEKQEVYSHVAIRCVLDKYNYLNTKSKAFIKRMAEGCLERKIQLDYIIDCFSKQKTNRMKPVIRCILEMGVYQILFMENVYDTAACNTAVNLAKKRGLAGLSGFVNGVLRTVCANKENITYPSPEKELLSYLSVIYSFPKWIVSMWMEQYGKEITQTMLASMLEEKKVTIRFDEFLQDAEREALIKEWAQNGSLVEKHPYLPFAYVVKKTDSIRNLAGFEEGKFMIQDISSMLVSQCAAPKRGQNVIDVCSAPGGKALHMACKLQNTGYVTACDLTESKVTLIQQNIDRMGYLNISAAVCDATCKNAEFIENADVVLADVPCSGLGVIGKKQDIKYRISEEKMEEIIALQRKILSNVWEYVKPGGIVMFSTCTVNKRENEENVKWFLEKYPFEIVPVTEQLPEILKNSVSDLGTLQLFPGIHLSDGFFIAKMRRKEKDK